jgi:zinc protease
VRALLAFTLVLAGCPSAPEPEEPRIETPPGDELVETPPVRQEPPASGEARDIHFPPIQRFTTDNGLEVNTVEWHQLPVVYVRLVVKSGSETDPANLQGLANLVSSMMKEGTRRRSSAQLAEDIEFLGADLWTEVDEENMAITMRALSSHLDQAMDIVADVTTSPAFRNDELTKLRRRESDRLRMSQTRPRYLANRAILRALYGEHPYGRYDTTQEVLDRVRTGDLTRWHRAHVVPGNAVLVVVGDVTPDQVRAATERAFGRWRGRPVPAPTYTEPPTRDRREVIVVDRPDSVQATMYIANLAIPRGHEDWVPLMVANQVLGGTAASRLFMDLRERRSLTYGTYSWIDERVQVGPFFAIAEVDSVDNAGNATSEDVVAAMNGLYEHIERIVREPAPEDELENARRYLSDSFPLEIDTPNKIAGLVSDLRVYGLPDDYWDGFRSSIRQVTPEQALEAARRHIHPDRSVVVIVGNAAAFAEALRAWGPVTVVDVNGRTTQELAASTQR